MYINDINIIAYVIVALLGAVAGQICDLLNFILPKHKKILSIENTKKYLKMSDKKIKSEFIKYFGEDKWNEVEAIENLNDIEYILSKVLVLPTIPVITEDIPEDSRLDLENQAIIISRKLILNKTEAVKCLVHEYRHLYQQVILQTAPEHPLYNKWLKNLKNMKNTVIDVNDPEEYTKYLLQPLELDAFAYTKYFFKKYLNQELICFNEEIEEVFDKYINTYIKYDL